ncbi:MAG: iron-containing alcohol dehydrogenase, partial [Pseudomonadota bacterium]
MTLINFLTRVHFADGVLEEALHSEMELHGKRRPLIIAENGHLTGAVAERFFASFPLRSVAETFTDVPPQATEAAAQAIAALYEKGRCDLLIAFGSNRAMDLAKVARIAIAHDEPVAALSSEEGGSQRIGPRLPDLYSVPGILGFASAISDYTRVRVTTGGQVLLSSRLLLPSVTICDPTLTLGAAEQPSAVAAAGILARGIDAYLAPGYNPPADGLALDSLSRVRTNIARVLDSDDLKARREMMASGLNSSLSLQKGLCVVHAISNAVASVASGPIDPSALGGILIPELVRFYGARTNGRTEQIKASLNLQSSCDLADGISEFLDDLPLPRVLRDVRVDVDTLEQAAALAVR